MFLGLGLGITPSAMIGRPIAPKLDLQFASGSYGVDGIYSASLPAAWSYTRSLAAYGQTLTGTLTSFAENTPRIISGRGLLLEPSRQNIVTYSQQLDAGGGWAGLNATVTANARTAPDGTATMDAIVESNTNNAVHRVQSVGINVTSGVTYAFSGYHEKGAADYVIINLSPGVFGTNSAAFNMATGAVVSATGGAASIEAMANGQYRWSVVIAATATSACQLFINPSTSSSSSAYVGVIGRTNAYAWGIQGEAGSAPSSYIANVASANTQGEDEPRLTIPAGASRYIIDLEGGSQLTGSVTGGDTFDFSPSAIPGVSGKYVSRLRII